MLPRAYTRSSGQCYENTSMHHFSLWRQQSMRPLQVQFGKLASVQWNVCYTWNVCQPCALALRSRLLKTPPSNEESFLKPIKISSRGAERNPVTRTPTFITPVLLNCFQNFFWSAFCETFFFAIFILCLPPCSWKAWQVKGCVDFHFISFNVIPRMYFRARQS